MLDNRKKGREGIKRKNAPAGSTCYCPQCGTVAPHKPGTPCVDSKCPNCGAPMTRKF